eukprot:CAMPEP_0198110778 /NCGR_PEP_ID=MMETSP1442-20131203/2785_1 /TAXON_ID= /ORGANISM="Craspedostauros australis, Strain CCMP3328" /LENGTH=262 /DNA_ID=CAMNT_0043766967 /DNA_START=43 /DNA_END=831 /DNA_ORIENTATION=-
MPYSVVLVHVKHGVVWIVTVFGLDCVMLSVSGVGVGRESDVLHAANISFGIWCIRVRTCALLRFANSRCEREMLLTHFISRMAQPNTRIIHSNSSDESNHDRSELLVRQFGGTVKASNSRFGVKTVNAIGKFLVDQKKELHKDGETGNILALQNQIYLVEQEAAMVVAKAIAKNPPKPLMAVIQPQNIAGPNIDSRMRPGERGGGAPCPAEFLMKREKRGERAGAGPSRHHPSAAPAAKTAESAADNANPATPDEEESNKTT